jgi:hypothetical protein
VKKNIALALLSTLLALAGVELLLRGIGPGNEVAYVLDDELIFAPAPGRRSRYVRFPEHGGHAIETRFNSLGFRGPEVEIGGAGGKRVVVYGDSFIQASYTRETETFAHRLQLRLHQRGFDSLRVINAGVDGFGPDQILVRMARELALLDPDLVVAAIFADNDFGDLLRNKLFRLDDSGTLVRHAFVVDPKLREHYLERERLDRAFALQKLFLDPALAKRDLRILLQRRFGLEAGFLDDVQIDTSFRTDPREPWIDIWRERGLREYREYVVERDPTIRMDNIRSDHYDADLSLEPHSASSRYKVALMTQVLSRMAALLRDRNKNLLLLVIPSPIDACDGYDWQVDGERYPAYDRRTLSGAVQRAAAEIGVAWVNLFDAFRGAQCNEMYFHHGNNHWTEKAQARAASIVAGSIARQGLLDPVVSRKANAPAEGPSP